MHVVGSGKQKGSFHIIVLNTVIMGLPVES